MDPCEPFKNRILACFIVIAIRDVVLLPALTLSQGYDVARSGNIAENSSSRKITLQHANEAITKVSCKSKMTGHKKDLITLIS